MTRAVDIEHLYAFTGDERLILLGSRAALELLAQAIRMLSENEERQVSLASIELGNEGPSIPLLKCRRNQQPLRCKFDGSCVSISGNEVGFDYLATSLEARAATWHDGGHYHLCPGLKALGDRDEYLVSPESEELLIGGLGYLDDAFFGLANG